MYYAGHRICSLRSRRRLVHED